MMITFKSGTAKGLTVQAGGRMYRFAGGVLTVASEEADDIRAWAKSHAYYKITEGGATADEPTPINARSSKADLLAAAAAKGITVAEDATKADILAALNNDTTEAETSATVDPDASPTTEDAATE